MVEAGPKSECKKVFSLPYNLMRVFGISYIISRLPED